MIQAITLSIGEFAILLVVVLALGVLVGGLLGRHRQ